jgi:PAS domain-containing protein
VERVGGQRDLVLILAKSFAAQLATAAFLVDAEGTVIYFNEAAERLLGQRFIEGVGMAAEEWSTRYQPRDAEGHTVPLESLPLGITMLKRETAHGILTISGADRVDRRSIPS